MKIQTNEKILKERLGENLRLYRKKADLSQMLLSMQADIGQNTIASIEIGKKWPMPRTLIKLSAALKIDPYQFFLPENLLTGKKTDKDYLSLLEAKKYTDNFVSEYQKQYSNDLKVEAN